MQQEMSKFMLAFGYAFFVISVFALLLTQNQVNLFDFIMMITNIVLVICLVDEVV